MTFISMPVLIRRWTERLGWRGPLLWSVKIRPMPPLQCAHKIFSLLPLANAVALLCSSSSIVLARQSVKLTELHPWCRHLGAP
jgi:hypothetical protein